MTVTEPINLAVELAFSLAGCPTQAVTGEEEHVESQLMTCHSR